MNDQRDGFEVFRTRLAAIALGTGVVGVAVMVISAAFEGFWAGSSPPEWRTFWAQLMTSFGAALLSIGIALLITDAVLKPTFARELLKVASLKQRIDDIGLLELGPADRIDWSGFFGRSRTINVVVMHPKIWLSRHLMEVTACARRSSNVRLFLLDPDSELLEAAAIGLSYSHSVYRREIIDFIEKVSSDWRAVPSPHKSSKLEIIHLLKPPTAAISRFDSAIVMPVPADPSDSSAASMYIELQEGQSDVQRWADARWEAMMSTVASTPAWSSAEAAPSAEQLRKSLGTSLHRIERAERDESS